MYIINTNAYTYKEINFWNKKYMLNIKINMFIRKPSVALSYLNLILDNFKFESLTGIIHQL